MQIERILITGGSGFLGQYLVQEILQAYPDAEIKILDLNPPRNPIHNFSDHPNVLILTGKDITDYQSIQSEFEGAELVIHLAGLVSFSIKDKEALERINIEGVQNVLAAAKKHQAKRVIHISSVAALGYKDHPTDLVDEEYQFSWVDAVCLNKHYMITKHHADEQVERFRKMGMDIVILYPGLMFGPGDRTNSMKLIEAVQLGKIPFNMPGGTNIVDVRDVAKGIVQTVEKDISNDSILLSGHNLTFEEINGTIAKTINKKEPSFTLPRFLNPILTPLMFWIENRVKDKMELTTDNLDSSFKLRYFSNQKALQTLGWSPQFEFSKTIEDTKNWMVSNRLLSKAYRKGLRDKVVIVTGASSGVGKSTAIAFAAQGAKVVITARRLEKLEEVQEIIINKGGNCFIFQGDVSNEESVKSLFEETLNHYGPVDLVINNAGRGLKSQLLDIDFEDWKNLWAANMDSVFLCSREAVRQMTTHRIQGHIITVSSIVGKLSFPGFSAYCASKHGVTGFKRSLWWELRKHRIRVSTIYPGRIDTEFFDNYPNRPPKSQMISADDIARLLVSIGNRDLADFAVQRLSILFKRIRNLLRL